MFRSYRLNPKAAEDFVNDFRKRQFDEFFLTFFSGPDKWHKDYPVANEGKRQSPIDIITDKAIDATSASTEKPLKWCYNTKHCLNIENTGSSWKVNVNGCGSCKIFYGIRELFYSEKRRFFEGKKLSISKL